MQKITKHKKYCWINRLVAWCVICAFMLTSIMLPSSGYAQSPAGASSAGINLPAPGTMISPSTSFHPPIVKGITLYPDNPLKIDFIVDPGDDNLSGEALRKEADRLIKYFMASLTVPEDEMWVNLSPYEKDRIIAKGLSQTELGRDLLAQDYVLKQMTSSLMYPENKLGSEFWERVYKRAYEKYGTTDIPMNTFNKVWIIPEKANVFVNGHNIFVLDNHLKVMLEEDYLALESNLDHDKHGIGKIPEHQVKEISDVSKEIIREIILPEIEKEVNHGKNFATLRQAFNSMILASWYKQNLKQSVLGQVYVDQNKVSGIDLEDKEIKEKIYNRYVEAFEKGVYDYIKQEYDATTQQIIPRKYFSGGIATRRTQTRDSDSREKRQVLRNKEIVFTVESRGIPTKDPAGDRGNKDEGIRRSGSHKEIAESLAFQSPLLVNLNGEQKKVSFQSGQLFHAIRTLPDPPKKVLRKFFKNKFKKPFEIGDYFFAFNIFGINDFTAGLKKYSPFNIYAGTHDVGVLLNPGITQQMALLDIFSDHELNDLFEGCTIGPHGQLTDFNIKRGFELLESKNIKITRPIKNNVTIRQIFYSIFVARFYSEFQATGKTNYYGIKVHPDLVDGIIDSAYGVRGFILNEKKRTIERLKVQPEIVEKIFVNSQLPPEIIKEIQAVIPEQWWQNTFLISKDDLIQKVESSENIGEESMAAKEAEALAEQSATIVQKITSEFKKYDYRHINLKIKESIVAKAGESLQDLFLIKDRAWFLQIERGDVDYYYEISLDGKFFEGIDREQFWILQMGNPDKTLFNLFDSKAEADVLTPTLWSWNDYRLFQENRKREDLHDQIDGLVKEAAAILEEKGKLEESEQTRIIVAIENLKVQLESLGHPLAGLTRGLEEKEETFVKSKEMALRTIDDILDPQIADKVKFRLERYSYHLSDKSNSALGLSGERIIIHPEVWTKINESEKTVELIAEISVRAALRDVEKSETELNFQIAESFSDGELSRLEKEISKEQTLWKKDEQADILRLFPSLKPEQMQMLRSFSLRDPSAMFATIEDFSWTDWNLFFDQFNEVIFIDGAYKERGLDGVFNQITDEVEKRVGDPVKREILKRRLSHVHQRLTFLRDYVLESFDDLDADTFSLGQWVWLSQLDQRIRNRILESRRFKRHQVIAQIVQDVFSKVREIDEFNNVEQVEDLERQSSLEPFRSLGLSMVIDAYQSLEHKGWTHRSWYAGDFFRIAQKSNIDLRYDVNFEDKQIDVDALRRIRSEAMQYLKKGVERLPKALMWKSLRNIEVKINFVPIPEEHQSTVKPQLFIAHYVPGTLWDEINLTMIGYPTGEQLDDLITTLIHELLHKLSLSYSRSNGPIYPDNNFHELALKNGFGTYFDIDRGLQGTFYISPKVTRKPITEMRSLRERRKYGYLHHVWEDREGRLLSFVPKEIIENLDNERIVHLLKEKGVEIIEDDRDRHILASPEETIAIVGSQSEESFRLRHSSLKFRASREETLRNLQKTLLRSTFPVAQRANGENIFEIYFPEGEKGFRTEYVDENEKTFKDLQEAMADQSSAQTSHEASEQHLVGSVSSEEESMAAEDLFTKRNVGFKAYQKTNPESFITLNHIRFMKLPETVFDELQQRGYEDFRPFPVEDAVTDGLMMHAIDIKNERSVLIKIKKGASDLHMRYGRHNLEGQRFMAIFDGGKLNDGTEFAVLEKIDGLSIKKLMDQDSKLSFNSALEMLIQFYEGLKYFHDLGLYHGELKDRHVLISESKGIGVIDPLYSSPDFYNPDGTPIHTEVRRTNDIVDGGGVFFKFFTGQHLFHDDTEDKIEKALRESTRLSIADQRSFELMVKFFYQLSKSKFDYRKKKGFLDRIKSVVTKTQFNSAQDVLKELYEVRNAFKKFATQEEVTDRKGGIDFNPNNLNLNVEGDVIYMDLSDPQTLNEMSVDGFVPVIIHVAPVQNIPLLIGVSEDPNELMDLSKSAQ